MKTKLLLVGGFLGAGKTTLLWETARFLMKQGKKVALITNDQAPELVDSALLQNEGLEVAEVSGSCFCCNFPGFANAIKELRLNAAPDVIIAEPVGSCADLSATIIQPLKKFYQADLEVAPFTVLADPARLTPIMKGDNGGLHQDAAYIYHKQLEEGDVILLTKADAYSKDGLDQLLLKVTAEFAGANVSKVSAQTGEGVEAWLEDVLTRTDAGKRLLDINYDIYAHGEAVLGWLNGTLLVKGVQTDWDAFAKNLLTALDSQFKARHAGIGHVKVIVENGQQYIVGNLAGDGKLSLRHSAGSSDEAKVIINARVEMAPEELDRVVRSEVTAQLGDKLTENVLAWKYLQPGRPNPTHRFDVVV
ncbi:MAG: cobalamin synthesis protein P47K [Bacteroidaceae bacterium]|nr:cobalamin synthesis protein P47K [Bacteroidaceae bacterium]